MALENLRIATPCKADWDEMSGTERVRFCGRCEKNVYNLSAMSRAEAEMLVQEKEGRVCLRLYRRADGTVITSDCPVGVRRQRVGARVWASISGVATSAALLLGLWSGRARADLAVSDGKKPASQEKHTVLMGGKAPAPTVKHLMGKVSVTPPPKPPVPVMGEPQPIMGDVAAPN